MRKPATSLLTAFFVCLVLQPAFPIFAQTGTSGEPVRYVGGVFIDPSVHDGRLRPAVGTETRQVTRANRTHPEWSDGHGWTYNHAPALAYWNGKFYLEYLSNPVGEHIAPGQTLVVTSLDGRNWETPEVVFPPFELPEGGPAMMHQRMGFFVAPNGRLLVLAFHGRAPNPFGEGGIGRVVREALADGSYGPIYFIRYNSRSGWDESNTHYPFYKRSPDSGFVEACDALLANKLITQQWWDESRSEDGFFAVTGRIQALSFYHRKDGKVVGLWKWSLGALSSDEGKSWSTPVRLPTLLMDGAKIWGQTTDDGRYALVYNPIDDSEHRYPLAIVTGDDGILFDDMLLVQGEVPPRRFQGKWKDWGSMYTRGIVEGNGNPPGNDMWISYSVNKEDMFVSRIPVPIRASVTGGVNDGFDDMESGGAIPDWNTYSLQWAPVAVVDFPSPSNKSLSLSDKDPYDYSRAVRVFPESLKARLGFKTYAAQTDTGRLEIEVMDRYGNRPVRIMLTEGGVLRVRDGSSTADIGSCSPGTWHDFSLSVDVEKGTFSLSLDGREVLGQGRFAETVLSVERLSFRTGSHREEPTRRMRAEPGPPDLPNADEPVSTAAYNIDNVTVEAVVSIRTTR